MTKLDDQLLTTSPFSKLWWRLVHFGFRLLYNEMAWSYDWVAWMVSLGQWRNWQRTALDHLHVESGACILELAHGTGNFQLDLYAHGYQRIGLDLSHHMGRLAQRKLGRHHLQAPLVRGAGQHLPFASQSFDAVVSTFPAPFIIAPATLNEACRVLKPGKRLVIVFGGILTGGGVLKDLLETAYRITGQRGPWPQDITERFNQAGFAVEFLTQQCPYSYAMIVVATRTDSAP